MGTIKSSEDLEVWKVGGELRRQLYQLARRLPEYERYNLAGQIRRAAVSLTANIAEGYGRYHFKENVQCCRVSRGSAYELLDHVITSRDESYLNEDDFQALRQELFKFIRLLNGYIKSIGNEKEGEQPVERPSNAIRLRRLAVDH